MSDFIKCQVCSSEFVPKRPSNKFCSYKCSNVSRGYYHKNKTLCEWCNQEITRPRPSRTHRFCSKDCEMADKRKDRVEIECQICHKKWLVSPSKKEKKFCSRKCMGKAVKEAHKSRKPQWRSYGECAMVHLLKKNYPSLTIVANDRLQLNGYELDIWIPELKTGVEYNGQHHFKPVYGQKVYERTQDADKQKLIIANQKEIQIVFVVPDGSISKTTKTRIQNMFVSMTKDIGLQPPTNLNFTKEEVLLEQSK